MTLTISTSTSHPKVPSKEKRVTKAEKVTVVGGNLAELLGSNLVGAKAGQFRTEEELE